MADENNVCGHEICDCAVGDGQQYCSDHCKEAERQDMTEIACDCGHSGCS